MTKAVDEAVGVRWSLLDRSFEPPSFESFDWVESLEHHALLFADRRILPGIAYLLESKGPCVSVAEFRSGDYWPAPRDFDDFRERRA